MAKRRVSNHMARQIAKKWMVKQGAYSVPDAWSHEDFAVELRKAKGAEGYQPFANRADAVAYIRETANGLLAGGQVKIEEVQ